MQKCACSRGLHEIHALHALARESNSLQNLGCRGNSWNLQYEQRVALCGAPHASFWFKKPQKRCIALHPALCLNIYICLKLDTPRRAYTFYSCLWRRNKAAAGQMATLSRRGAVFPLYTSISQGSEARSVSSGQPQLTKHGRRFILICQRRCLLMRLYDVLRFIGFPECLWRRSENNALICKRALAFRASRRCVCVVRGELLPFLAFYSMNLQSCMKWPRAPVNK